MSYPTYHSDGFLMKDHSGVYLLSSALLGFLVVLVWRRTGEPTIPIVNSYSGDVTLKKAQSRFMSDARGLIKEGIQKVSWVPSLQKHCISCTRFSLMAHFAS